jgi:hypothetical protein
MTAPVNVEAVLRAALVDVCNPIGKLQRDCPPGHELNHSAITIGGSLQYVQSIAREALKATGCIRHPERPIRETLDGDALCQECCDQWARAEQAAS